MKNPLEMLKQISNLLNVELSEEVKETEVQTEEVKVELAQMTLDNGTVIEAEVFEAGAEVFVVSDEDRIALPVGEYEMEDSQVLKVEEEGIIASIGAAEEAPAEEVEAAEEEEEMGYATKMELEEVKEMVKEVKEMVAAMGDKKEEMSSEEEILREELSQPAAEPIKHNPESGTEKKVNFYSQNRPQTTLDRVMARISNIK